VVDTPGVWADDLPLTVEGVLVEPPAVIGACWLALVAVTLPAELVACPAAYAFELATMAAS
jgi:hypothetical protein